MSLVGVLVPATVDRSDGVNSLVSIEQSQNEKEAMLPERNILPTNGESRQHLVDSLLETYESNRGVEQLVILQGTPDPDAISSAMAIEYIGKSYDIETTILIFHNVSHNENRALVKRLGINLVKYENEIDLSRFSFYSIVDSQKFHTPIDSKLEASSVQFLAHLDHHREDGVLPPAKIVDIRTNVQSTAAIICDYIKAVCPEGLNGSEERESSLATALMHGIRTDTKRFVTATRYDYDAARWISSAVDNQAIKHIERRVLTPSMLSIFEAALVNRSIHDNFIFSHVGSIREIDRDGIPQAADLLLSREGTDTVLVFGIVNENTIDGSLRTNSETINPDEFLKALLGASPDSGEYYGGGNIRDRGGFQIPLGFFSMHEDKELVYRMARELIERAFLEHIGKARYKKAKSRKVPS